MFIEKGKIYCLLGFFGVGKFILLNYLFGEEKMRISVISDSVNKGKYIISYCEFIVLEGGGILIDNLGMWEVGIIDIFVGIEVIFDILLGYVV